MTRLYQLRSWLGTLLFGALFGGLLLGMHPLLLGATLLSDRVFAGLVVFMNRAILALLKITTRATFRMDTSVLPMTRPLIVVSNHQSMFDIPMLVSAFARHAPLFISKRELARSIPSVSLTLRHGRSALIDRADREQAIPEIARAGSLAEAQCRAVCIFPEGTRSRDGRKRSFRNGGLLTLLEAMPSALVVPVAIKGSWELMRWGFRPIPADRRVTLTILPAIEPASTPPEEICALVERGIREQLDPESPEATP